MRLLRLWWQHYQVARRYAPPCGAAKIAYQFTRLAMMGVPSGHLDLLMVAYVKSEEGDD